MNLSHILKWQEGALVLSNQVLAFFLFLGNLIWESVLGLEHY
jgi:hypothetical protein